MKPTLTSDQEFALRECGARLTAALEPICVPEPTALASLRDEAARLAREIGAIESSQAALDEATAEKLVRLRTQRGHCARQITALEGSHATAIARAESERDEAIDAAVTETKTLLAAVATDFAEQHESFIRETLAPYAMDTQADATAVKLLPWFLIYRRCIRAFSEATIPGETILEHVHAALRGEDFLMQAAIKRAEAMAA